MKPMILHHWDADGICSAALLIRVHGEQEHMTPTIGNYFLCEEDLNALRGHEEVIIADMNLPDAHRVCEFARLRIYDHHLTRERVSCALEHINPALEGHLYPSATTVIMKHHSLPFDHLVALGIVGDKGKGALETEFGGEIRKYLEKSGRAFEDLLTAVNLLDSSYKVDRRDEVVENVYLVAEGLDAVLGCERLRRNVEVVEREIERCLAVEPEVVDGALLLRMRTRYHIISTVTRRLAWGRRATAIVINERGDRDEMYVRSVDRDISHLIDIAKSRGYLAGGKREVMGAILPPGEARKFVAVVLEALR